MANETPYSLGHSNSSGILNLACLPVHNINEEEVNLSQSSVGHLNLSRNSLKDSPSGATTSKVVFAKTKSRASSRNTEHASSKPEPCDGIRATDISDGTKRERDETMRKRSHTKKNNMRRKGHSKENITVPQQDNTTSYGEVASNVVLSKEKLQEILDNIKRLAQENSERETEIKNATEKITSVPQETTPHSASARPMRSTMIASQEQAASKNIGKIVASDEMSAVSELTMESSANLIKLIKKLYANPPPPCTEPPSPCMDPPPPCADSPPPCTDSPPTCMDPPPPAPESQNLLQLTSKAHPLPPPPLRRQRPTIPPPPPRRKIIVKAPPPPPRKEPKTDEDTASTKSSSCNLLPPTSSMSTICEEGKEDEIVLTSDSHERIPASNNSTKKSCKSQENEPKTDSSTSASPLHDTNDVQSKNIKVNKNDSRNKHSKEKRSSAKSEHNRSSRRHRRKGSSKEEARTTTKTRSTAASSPPKFDRANSVKRMIPGTKRTCKQHGNESKAVACTSANDVQHKPSKVRFGQNETRVIAKTRAPTAQFDSLSSTISKRKSLGRRRITNNTSSANSTRITKVPYATPRGMYGRYSGEVTDGKPSNGRRMLSFQDDVFPFAGERKNGMKSGLSKKVTGIPYSGEPADGNSHRTRRVRFAY